ncbi:MAG: CsbD family protein [Nitriliruptoraceae bacterium]
MSNHDKLEGKAKEVTGKVSGEKDLEAEGKAQRAKGTIEEKLDDLKETTRGAAKAARDAVGGDDDTDEDRTN